MKVKNRFNGAVVFEYQAKRDAILFGLDKKKFGQARLYNHVCNFARRCPLTIVHIKEEAFK